MLEGVFKEELFKKIIEILKEEQEKERKDLNRIYKAWLN